MKSMLLVCMALGVMLAATACGDDGSKTCKSICKSAQNQDCTIIDDCDKFCDAAAALAIKASCQSQYDAYDSCANSTATCSIDATCGSQQMAFGICAESYCSANATDSDCIKLDESM